MNFCDHLGEWVLQKERILESRRFCSFGQLSPIASTSTNLNLKIFSAIKLICWSIGLITSKILFQAELSEFVAQLVEQRHHVLVEVNLPVTLSAISSWGLRAIVIDFGMMTKDGHRVLGEVGVSKF